MNFLLPAHRARALRELRRRDELEGAVRAAGGADAIPETMSFLEWVEGLARAGLKVDGQPFDLTTRPALREIYAAVPTTKAAGYDTLFTVMKGAQTGATVLTFLLQLYLVLKYEPLKVAAYYPDRGLAAYVSSSRFMPVVRSVPVAHRALLAANGGAEGNVLTRQIGASEVLFLWTSGSSATESFPLGCVVADEVQNMLDDDIERIRERMSASDVRFFFACSTAKWPGADIDLLFQRGDQRRFHTDCACDDGVVLDDAFPECIQFNDGRWPEAPRDYVYCCPACGTHIADPQRGRWVKHNPSSRHVSFHLPQTLSPTVSAREMVESFRAATDLQNFWNRKLGRPWTDPSQVPITLAICERQVEAGRQAGVVWKVRANGTVMGIDQMGGFNVAVVLERMPDGRMALVHTEFVYGSDPFERCSEMMDQFGVRACVVETLPNANDARRFANRHLGRVYLAGYADLHDDAMVWSDQLTRSDRRTAAEDRTSYTVTLNQFRVMQAALARIVEGELLFPDPNALHQDVLDKGQRRRTAILREVFLHFTKVALVVTQDEKTRRPRPRVEKVGLDPHAAFAFMLATVAWSRANTTGVILFPESPTAAEPTRAERIAAALPGIPDHVLAFMDSATPGTCGRCSAFEPRPDDGGGGRCRERRLTVAAADPACPVYVPRVN